MYRISNRSHISTVAPLCFVDLSGKKGSIMSEIKTIEDIDEKLRLDGVNVDWFLQNLSCLTNSSELEFGITLNVSGQTISGIMIGGKKYFEMFAELFSDEWPNNEKDEIREIFLKNTEVYSLKDGEAKLPPAQYIHLKDATVFHGDCKLPSEQGMLWRGKINAISGFHLGELT